MDTQIKIKSQSKSQIIFEDDGDVAALLEMCRIVIDVVPPEMRKNLPIKYNRAKAYHIAQHILDRVPENHTEQKE